MKAYGEKTDRREFFVRTGRWAMMGGIFGMAGWLVGSGRSLSSESTTCSVAPACGGCRLLPDCNLPPARFERRIDPRFSQPPAKPKE